MNRMATCAIHSDGGWQIRKVLLGGHPLRLYFMQGWGWFSPASSALQTS